MLRDMRFKNGQNPLHYPKQGISPTVITEVNFFSHFLESYSKEKKEKSACPR